LIEIEENFIWLQ